MNDPCKPLIQAIPLFSIYTYEFGVAKHDNSINYSVLTLTDRMSKLHFIMINLHPNKELSHLSDLDRLVNLLFFYLNDSTGLYAYMAAKTQKYFQI